MHPRLAELSEHLALQRRTLLDVASTVPADSWQTRPGDGETWSVSEVLEHLYRVERGAAAVLTKRAVNARTAVVASTSLVGGFDLDDKRVVRDSSRARWTAPPGVVTLRDTRSTYIPRDMARKLRVIETE